MSVRLRDWNLLTDEAKRELIGHIRDIVFRVQLLETILDGIIASEGDKYGGLYAKLSKGILDILHGKTS